MSHHARIEELSDTDSDPPEDDPSDFVPELIRPSKPSQSTQPLQQLQPQPPSNFKPTPPPDYKHYQCLYPLYFDASRTRKEGRRVGAELAVENPLAREIVDAVQLLGLKTVFEPGKIHPRDWSNPGRVRVLVKEAGRGKGVVKNKHHLYILVSQHLQAHPTTSESPLRLRIQGMPLPDGPIPPPTAPRGWKINMILPLHSPALSGGGVSENVLKDMMAEMQGGGMPGIPGAPGGSIDAEGAGQVKRKREGGKKK